MNRTIVLRISAIAAGILLTGGLLFLFYTLRIPADTSNEVSSAAIQYILREYDGKLAVYKAGESTPSRILDMETRLLPSYDQGLLRAGIEVSSPEELNQLLEDYTS